MSGLDRSGFLAQGVLMVPPASAKTAVRLFNAVIEGELERRRGQYSAEAIADARRWWNAHLQAASSDIGTSEPVRSAGGVHSRREVSRAEAAAMLQVSAEYVGRLCRDGRLDARKAGGVWLITEASVRALRDEREDVA